jgi:hypothetical protein
VSVNVTRGSFWCLQFIHESTKFFFQMLFYIKEKYENLLLLLPFSHLLLYKVAHRYARCFKILFSCGGYISRKSIVREAGFELAVLYVYTIRESLQWDINNHVFQSWLVKCNETVYMRMCDAIRMHLSSCLLRAQGKVKKKKRSFSIAAAAANRELPLTSILQ